MNEQNVVTTDNRVTINMPFSVDDIKWINTASHQMNVKCPHCGKVETTGLSEEWEYIAEDKQWSWTCEYCNQDYAIAVETNATLHLTLGVKE